MQPTYHPLLKPKQPPPTSPFYQQILHLYYHQVILKIKTFLHADTIVIKGQQITQGRGYNKLSDAQLQRRGHYLYIFYEGLSNVKEMSLFWSTKEELTNDGQKPTSYFQQFVRSLLLSIQQMTKLQRIIKYKEYQQHQIHTHLIVLLQLLFQTEIYCLQILLRIIIIRQIQSQRELYQRSLRHFQLQFRYLHHYHTHSTIREIVHCKTMTKDINKILMFYHCALSLNRDDCSNKIQIGQLFVLLRYKLDGGFFGQMMRKCDFRKYVHDYKRQDVAVLNGSILQKKGIVQQSIAVQPQMINQLYKEEKFVLVQEIAVPHTNIQRSNRLHDLLIKLRKGVLLGRCLRQKGRVIDWDTSSLYNHKQTACNKTLQKANNKDKCKEYQHNTHQATNFTHLHLKQKLNKINYGHRFTQNRSHFKYKSGKKDKGRWCLQSQQMVINERIKERRQQDLFYQMMKDRRYQNEQQQQSFLVDETPPQRICFSQTHLPKP